jgi:hypothetical protein
MGLLDNGGRKPGQWPPLPLKHFPKKWNSLSVNISGKACPAKSIRAFTPVFAGYGWNPDFGRPSRRDIFGEQPAPRTIDA